MANKQGGKALSLDGLFDVWLLPTSGWGLHPNAGSRRTIAKRLPIRPIMMNPVKRTLVNLALGVVTCVLLMTLSTPSLSTPATSAVDASQLPSLLTAPSHSTTSITEPQILSPLQAAESVWLAQGMAPSSMQRYAALLTKANVVPTLPSTDAMGVAGAVLVGDRLVVRGDFSRLSSPLRDYATDPVSPPNPNITSAVHLHRGAPSENGPFQYALTVTLNPTGMGGRFAGDYTLTSEQRQALADGLLYVDLHTQQNRAGELRGILQPM